MQRQQQPGEIGRQIDEARRLIDKGLNVEAISLLQAVLDEEPERTDALYLLGLAQLHAGQFSLALENVSQLVALAPDEPDGHSLLGEIYTDQRLYDQGIASYQTALELDAEHLSALTGLGKLLVNRGDNSGRAIEVLEKAVKLKPSFHSAQICLAMALRLTGRMNEAVKHGYKAIKLAPKSSNYFFILAKLLLESGDKKKAYRLLDRALSLDPLMGVAYAMLARSHKFTAQDQSLLKKMNRALERPMSPASRKSLHFALGKAYDDMGEWDEAFGHFQQANRLVHVEYDGGFHEKEVKALAKYFTPGFFNAHADWSVDSDVPIFIVGMARSGSTLVDQILSTHARVESVGEFGGLWTLIQGLCDQRGEGKGFPFCLDRVTGKDIQSLAEEYLAGIQDDCDPNASRIVSKQLNNFSALGVIALAFPNAKVIHTYRHPLDTCLSCFFQSFEFPEMMSWAFDLKDIGKFYRNYRRCMSDWKRSLPIPMLDVCYESMVEDPDSHIRRLLEFCELDWDPQVMDFYESNRPVQTASLMQVRQPIYKSSKARWKHYAKHLQPLVDVLGDVLEGEATELEAAGLKVKKSFPYSLKRLWR